MYNKWVCEQKKKQLKNKYETAYSKGQRLCRYSDRGNIEYNAPASTPWVICIQYA